MGTQFYASGGPDGKVKVWKFDNLHYNETLTHMNSVVSIAFSQHGYLLAAGTSDGIVYVWSLQ